MRPFRSLLLTIAFLYSGAAFPSPESAAAEKPNVLFVAIDDLNHWVKHLGRNPQAITPHLDRLAARGVSFARAYCAAPACNPSRAALLSGMRPFTTGVYDNPTNYRPRIRPDQTLNSHFRANGYYAAGAGKIYHGGGGRLDEWDDYLTRAETREAAEPSDAYVDKNHNGIRWAQLKGGDESVSDYHTVSYCIEQLERAHEKPFFLACGIYRPHMPWNVPKKYFDLYPLEKVELPPHQENDLDDVPAPGARMARQRDHSAITSADAWKEAVQAYLASVSYADAQLGRLLDAFDKSEHAKNTIIVLWGDHGWHLGEKRHWRKFALWEEATRAPLIWVAPGVTPEGVICERTVDLMSLYPTLCELAGLPAPDHVEGQSIASLLKDPKAAWDRPALTTHGRGNHAVRTERWRYIRYANGSEELYDHAADPYEWTNLAGDARHAELKRELREWLPREEAAKPRGGRASVE